MKKTKLFTLVEAVRGLVEGNVSVMDVRRQAMERRELWQGWTNAFSFLNDEMDGGEAAGKRWERKEPVGLLDGLPIAVKDNFAVRGLPLTCSSVILDGHVASYTATVVNRLKGAHVVGKTRLDEFAMGTATFSGTGWCYSPRTDAVGSKYTPGGSSGGSAAAVASGAALVGLGSDTGGSVRQPGAFCGVVGFKPTYGVFSRFGLVAFASSLDCPGVLTRSVEDARLCLEVCGGFDRLDGTSSRLRREKGGLKWREFEEKLDRERGMGLKGVKIGMLRDASVQDLDRDVMQRWEQGAEYLASQGAEICTVDIPSTRQALAAYYVIAPAEAASNLARYDGRRYGSPATDSVPEHRSRQFGPEVQRRILAGNFLLRESAREAYLQAAWNVRRSLKHDFHAAFQHVDAILTPTAPTVPWKQHKSPEIPPTTLYLSDFFTVPASLAGLPAISVPTGTAGSSSLPLGLQLVGKPYHDAELLRFAAALESHSDWGFQECPIPPSLEK